MEVTVDMSECGFVDTPVVTTSLAGNGFHDFLQGTSAPWEITKTGFRLVVENSGIFNPSLNRVHYYKWHVNWIAVGYVCEV